MYPFTTKKLFQSTFFLIIKCQRSPVSVRPHLKNVLNTASLYLRWREVSGELRRRLLMEFCQECKSTAAWFFKEMFQGAPRADMQNKGF